MFLYVIYRILSPLIPWVGVVLLGRRVIKEPAYMKRIQERFGSRRGTSHQNSLWFHAVSAGEVNAVIGVIEAVMANKTHFPILITTSTPSGSKTVKNHFGDSVDHCYLPYDAVWCLKRFLKRHSPRALLLVETEIWPNLIVQCKRHGVPVYLINGRLSEQSFASYNRVSSFTRWLLPQFDCIATQYQDSADRFTSLGARSDQIEVTGNVKFDIELDDGVEQDAAKLRKAWFHHNHVWIAASTHTGEEEFILRVHQRAKKQNTSLGLLLAPRHPHRADSIKSLALAYGLKVALLSEEPQPVDILIIDQMGVLLPLYALSDVVFIGGSLQGHGGHNPIEPAILSRPMLMGPDRFNFEEVCMRFEQTDSLQIVKNEEELLSQLLHILENPSERNSRGMQASSVVEANRGATNRLATLIESWLTVS